LEPEDKREVVFVNTSAKKLVCREIWGGNKAVDQLVEFGRFYGRLLSLPYDSNGGGDIHFLSTCDRDMLAKIVIADVAGHGDIVSRIAVELRGLLRRNLNEVDNSKLLMSLNDSLGHTLKQGKFVTMAATTFRSDDGRFIYASAGHPTILKYDATRGDWQRLQPLERANSGIPLGIIGNTEYFQQITLLNKDDMLLFYTDGILDVKIAGNGRPSANELIDFCRKVTPPSPKPDEVLTSLITRIEQVSEGGFGDDVTALMVKVS
jgi:sigma-B regulation protein RsbU (phosphoserine phosphatase)